MLGRWTRGVYSLLDTVPPCLPGRNEYVICSTVLEETAESGGRIDNAGFPLLTIEGETTLAKHLIITDVILFVFTSFLYDLLFLHLLFTLMPLDLPQVRNINNYGILNESCSFGLPTHIFP
jgi:hypothetical protein